MEVLSSREPPIALADLADAVAARESEMEADDVFGHTADELVPVLHHIHLPKLADENVIEYDPERNAVTSVEREVLTPLENA